MIDVGILSHCFNEYVRTSMREMGPYPIHCNSLPALSNNCWLETSGVKPDTLKDNQMIIYFDNSKKRWFM